MKTTIDVANRREGDQIRRALEDPQVRAFVKVMGTLLALPSDRSRERVLRFVADQLDEYGADFISPFNPEGIR